VRTAIAQLVIQAARRVLQEHAEGRSVDPLRLDWAIDIVLANAPRELPVAHGARQAKTPTEVPHG